ncbi:MAG: response regulator [Bryobacteraceae bacterium]|jgi:DNA-binding NtrC family response regulator
MSTILFVEDEHAWRAVFGEFLRNEGFTVLEAADITEATDACRELSEPVDLSIIDVKSGMRLARRLTQRYPHMSVLFIGDSEEMSGQSPPQLTYEYLRKPFTAETLLKSVQGLIQSGAASWG